MHTQYIDQHPELTQPHHPDVPLDAVLGVAALEMMAEKTPSPAGTAAADSNWRRLGLAETLAQRF
jgi:hypothetical protein